MAVYVDDLHNYGIIGNSFWCHMWADDMVELIAMSKVLGLRKSWIDTTYPKFIHFDLSESKRTLALELGAIYNPKGIHLRATYPELSLP